MANRFFVTGTDTNVGKTIVSAVLCAALDSFYWKPIQTGTCEGTDRNMVMKLAGIPASRTIPEAYCFAPPVSPHLAAHLTGAKIALGKIRMPKIVADESLIVEGAGGALVPINRTQLMTHVMKRLQLPVLLVSRTTLGTINHTLLTLAALRAAEVDVCGVIMVGKPSRENRNAIEHYGEVGVIGAVPLLAKINRRSLLGVFQNHFDRKVFHA